MKDTHKAWGAEACPIIGHYLIAGVCVRCGWSPSADSGEAEHE